MGTCFGVSFIFKYLFCVDPRKWTEFFGRSIHIQYRSSDINPVGRMLKFVSFLLVLTMGHLTECILFIKQYLL